MVEAIKEIYDYQLFLVGDGIKDYELESAISSTVGSWNIEDLLRNAVVSFDSAKYFMEIFIDSISSFTPHLSNYSTSIADMNEAQVLIEESTLQQLRYENPVVDVLLSKGFDQLEYSVKLLILKTLSNPSAFPNINLETANEISMRNGPIGSNNCISFVLNLQRPINILDLDEEEITAAFVKAEYSRCDNMDVEPGKIKAVVYKGIVNEEFYKMAPEFHGQQRFLHASRQIDPSTAEHIQLSMQTHENKLGEPGPVIYATPDLMSGPYYGVPTMFYEKRV
jgi:hypothetical protein